MTVTVKFGLEQSTSAEVTEGTTVEQVLDKCRDELWYGYNIKAYVNGRPQPLGNVVDDGDTIQVETQPNSVA